MRLLEDDRANDSNPQNLYINLNDALQANLRKIQRYCEEYPEWESGRKFITTEESIMSSFKYTGRVSYTPAQIFNNKSAGLLTDAAVKTKQYSSSSPACLRIEGATEATLLISFNADEMKHKPLVMYTPNQMALNPKNILMQYVAFAETVDESYSKMFEESWDKSRDSLMFLSGSGLFTDEYKVSFDRARIGQTLEFHHLAKLILHLREIEKIQKQPLNLQTALITYQEHNKYPCLSGDEAKNNRYLLSEKNLNWIKQQIILRVTNGHMRGNIYRDASVCLESEDECLARLKSEISLILTTNIRELFSATELLALISAATNLFNEHVDGQKFAQNEQKDKVRLLTENRTSFASKYIFAQKAPRLAQFLQSLAPLFTFSLITEKLKQDKASAAYLFNCLFGDEAQLKIYTDMYYCSEGPRPDLVTNSSGFLEYDELVEICAVHFDANQNDIFIKAYKSLTGHDKPSSSPKNVNIQPDQIKGAFDKFGLSVEASRVDVKKKFRELALRYHPDKNLDVGAAEKFKEVNEAYSLLMEHFDKLEGKQNVTSVEEPSAQEKPEQNSQNYIGRLIAIRKKILEHDFGGKGDTQNKDDVSRSASASIILQKIDPIIEKYKIIHKNHFELIKLAIQAELKDKTQTTSGFLGIGGRSLSTAQLYLDILNMLDEIPAQPIKFRPKQ